jgi:hypothetical protein
MTVGNVIKWNNFEDGRKGGETKARWFICLGDSGLFSVPIYIYICTTTTQKSDFQKGGKRANHSYKLFSPTGTPFDSECLLDFDEPPWSYPKEIFENNPDIEILGTLDENTLRSIYNGLLKSNAYSKKILLDIHESFNMVGIENLKKPK